MYICIFVYVCTYTHTHTPYIYIYIFIYLFIYLFVYLYLWNYLFVVYLLFSICLSMPDAAIRNETITVIDVVVAECTAGDTCLHVVLDLKRWEQRAHRS